MPDIEADEISSFQHGKRQLMRVTVPGKTTQQFRAGSLDVPYAVGDILLADEADNVIVGPLSLSGTIEMAERILDGDQRTITDPLAMLALATAVVGFAVTAEPSPPGSVPAAAAKAVPA